MNHKPHVISIAAVSGGGKTTIVNHLMGELESSKALYFDDYDFENCPTDICEWVEKGANYNEWNLTPLITDIQHHLQNQSHKYILLDYPFAYLNKEISSYIDMAIFIDTPLDIAMARRLLRDYTDNPITEVRNDVINYLSRGRNAYLEMQRSVKPNSDLTIKGELPTQVIITQLLEEFKNRGLL